MSYISIKHRRDYYYDFKISDDLIIPSEISWDIKNNELKEIHLTLGRKGMNNRWITEEYFTECIEQYHSDIVYNIFHRKYGTPDELNSEGRYPCWEKSNGVDIRFSRGYKNDYTCDTSRYVMGAFIYWSFDSEIETERDFRIMDDNLKLIDKDI